ncbi:OmpA/MotB family protein [Mesonia mobilis]|uniref:Flagellar motor protein MotB n=1 Tax=Mesonia mobilis TaxID=369791 RepID=A0ABQ3BLJ4_9FLAO|nr:flagellar motor protein MotB [Mesonia mobilis]MBQ0738718.1 flagellar motor protein MotB [Aquimarina celericrescens]GGZ49740.1 flagellar motor protein MotB [Mesonia mobilis]
MKKVMMLSAVSLSLLLGSCVSKKKYTELETQLDNTQSELMKTRVDKEDCEEKYAQVQERVSNYYAKINSLQEENDNKLEMVDNIAAMSTKSKEAMRKTLAKVDPEKLKDAKTLSDSIDVAVSYNLTKSLNEGEDDGIDINVEETVVQITISDELLFKSGSYWVNPKANKLLEKIAKVVKSEPSMEVLVEGHTDDQTIVEDSYLEDNWDLSVRRATSIVRVLQDKYGVEGKQLIASGRSSYMPLDDNETAEGREKNRRTRILILPNLDKFLAMLES